VYPEPVINPRSADRGTLIAVGTEWMTCAARPSAKRWQRRSSSAGSGFFDDALLGPDADL
jgi:hypothetical protein